VETCFQTSKNAVGLDERQVRRWDFWYRHTTLVMLAHAILTVIAALERARPPADRPAADPTTAPISNIDRRLHDDPGLDY
jgi:SRSO17 transposase